MHLSSIFFLVAVYTTARVSTVQGNLDNLNGIIGRKSWRKISRWIPETLTLSLYGTVLHPSDVIKKDTDKDEDIVTTENVVEKVWKLHLILSAVHVGVLENYLSLLIQLHKLCNVYYPCSAQFVLNLQEMYPVFDKMLGSLQFFDRYSNGTRLTNQVRDALEHLLATPTRSDTSYVTTLSTLETAYDLVRKFYIYHVNPAPEFAYLDMVQSTSMKSYEQIVFDKEMDGDEKLQRLQEFIDVQVQGTFIYLRALGLADLNEI